MSIKRAAHLFQEATRSSEQAKEVAKQAKIEMDRVEVLDNSGVLLGAMGARSDGYGNAVISIWTRGRSVQITPEVYFELKEKFEKLWHGTDAE